MSVIWRNRAGNQRALVELRHPTTEPELRDIVGEAASHGRPLKAVGAGLACSDMALTHGILLSLEDYGRVVSLDAERMEVTVQAGARLGEVTRHLAGRGFAFESTGGSAAQTIAGAVATGFSGTGTRSAGLSAAVTGMRLIDAEGVVHETHRPLRSNGAGGSGARGAPHRGEDTAPDSPERLMCITSARPDFSSIIPNTSRSPTSNKRNSIRSRNHRIAFGKPTDLIGQLSSILPGRGKEETVNGGSQLTAHQRREQVDHPPAVGAVGVERNRPPPREG